MYLQACYPNVFQNSAFKFKEYKTAAACGTADESSNWPKHCSPLNFRYDLEFSLRLKIQINRKHISPTVQFLRQRLNQIVPLVEYIYV